MDDCVLNTREEIQVYVLALVPLYDAHERAGETGDFRVYETAINKIKARDIESLDRETLQDILLNEVFKGNTEDYKKYAQDFVSAFDLTVSDREELALKIKKMQALTAMRPKQPPSCSKGALLCAAN